MVFVLALVFTSSRDAAAQTQTPPFRLAYELSMPRPESHLFEVKIEVEAQSPVDSIALQMPRWSPGRYAVYDFAKNVQELRADAACEPNIAECLAPVLPVTRIDDQTWRVNMKGARRVRVSYKVFANNLSGTFSQLDRRHANYNGASLFMYVVDHKQDPVRLKINPPPNWRITNGRTDRPDQREWLFPNYDILIDTPTEIAPDWTADEFRVDGKLYRVVVHSFGDEAGKRARLVRDLEKIARAETAMWGTPDFDAYTFLIHFAPRNESGGDGMEHLTSTQIILPLSLAADGGYDAALDTAAHELFHAWNVKRLRPVELGPWDFTRPVNTRALWIAEGLTNYYGYLMQRRAGLWSNERLFKAYSDTITLVENSPGSRLISAEEASVIAPFIDRTPHAQRTNLAATTTSYYLKGELLGLTLDLLIRGRTGGKRSLDDVMRRMYAEFYVQSPAATYYLRGRGYTSEDFERVVSEITGADMSRFFANHVRGVEAPPYDEALAAVGLRMSRVARRDQDTARAGAKSQVAYRIEEMPNASAEMRALRDAWTEGERR